MEKDQDFKSSVKAEDPINEEVQKLLPTLEQETSWDGYTVIKYNGTWYRLGWLEPILRIKRYCKPRDFDIILSTMPKSGTTWLKALAYSIANRNVHDIDDDDDDQLTAHPLFTSNPHELVRSLELNLYREGQNPNLEDNPRPRIIQTHLSYDTLPKAFHKDSCKIIYICRNPLDQFVSERHYLLENELLINKDAMTVSIDDSFGMFCRGVSPCGPHWEHALGYWNAHLKNPGKVLFLKYEDLKKDDKYYIKKIAEFIGFPFSPEEEENGLIEKISKLCSFENLRNLEVNKEGSIGKIVKKSTFFRKGETGDWTNHLTKEMAQRMKDVMMSKLEGSGLVIDIPGLS